MLITLGRLVSIACLISALAFQAHAQEMPQRGTSKAAVEQKFGTPLKKHSPVGSPPITRWDYQDYSVYFEKNTTLHSVSHQAAAIRRAQPAATPTQQDTTHTTHHGTVLALPEIEEIAPTNTPDATSENEEQASPTGDANEWDGSFRFDPTTGRIVPTSEANHLEPNHIEPQSKQGAKKHQTIEPTLPTPATASETIEEDLQETIEIVTEEASIINTTESETSESNDSGGFQMNW